MSYGDPINIEDVDISKIELSFPKNQPNETYGRICYIFHNKQKFRVILPEMNAPFGAGPGRTELTANRYSIGLSFDGMNEDSKRGQRLARAHQKIAEIDQRISDMIMERKDVFYKDTTKGKKAVNDEVIRARYKNFLYSSGDDHPDRIFPSLQLPKPQEADKLKLTSEDREQFLKTFKTLGKQYPLLYDEKGNAVIVTTDNVTDEIPRATRIKPVIEFSYLWFRAGDVGANPALTFIHGLRCSDISKTTFNIRADDDEEMEEQEVEEQVEEDELVEEEEEEEEEEMIEANA